MNLYNSYLDNALKICGGDNEKAHKFIDCSAYEYEYNVQAHNRYVEWHNAALKATTTNNEAAEINK